MKIYAGEPGNAGFGKDRNPSQLRVTLDVLWEKRLYSYYYILVMERSRQMGSKKVELFLDSGAYSAWAQKKEIDIYEYIDFIKKNRKLISVYANLDDITSAENTWKNQKIMEEAGLNPLPVFHYGEDEKYLIRLLKDPKYKYISLGGMVPVPNNKLVQWLDRIFSDHLTNKKGMPRRKIHGFGLTSLRLMLRYPWFSVDSTSWVVTGRMGAIYIPKRKNGRWIYDEDSWKVNVSNRSSSVDEKGKHIATMRDAEKKVLLEYIESKGYKLGMSEFHEYSQDTVLADDERWAEKKPKDPNKPRKVEKIAEDGVSNRYQLRDEINILYFLDLEKSMPKWPWAFKKVKLQKGLFD